MAEAEKLADEASMRAAATERQLAAAEDEIRRLRKGDGHRAAERVRLLERCYRPSGAHLLK